MSDNEVSDEVRQAIEVAIVLQRRQQEDARWQGECDERQSIADWLKAEGYPLLAVKALALEHRKAKAKQQEPPITDTDRR